VPLRPRPTPDKPPRAEPAAVVPIRPAPVAEDWRNHPLDCECSDCLYSEPKYARPYAGSGVES
jgi:hypothetical protein